MVSNSGAKYIVNNALVSFSSLSHLFYKIGIKTETLTVFWGKSIQLHVWSFKPKWDLRKRLF